MTDTVDFKPKLGCLPPINKPALVLSDFFTGVLPPTPAVDYLGYRSSWPWWLNNQYGVCVAATKQGIKALVSAKLTGHEIVGTDAEVIADYKTQNPNFPAQDNGMDIQTFLEYLQKKGEIVAFGTVPLSKHDAAISILGFVWTAIAVRSASYDDYNARRDWDYHPGSPIEGYHSVFSAGHRDTAADDVRFETWTRENGFTQAFWAHDVQQTWGVIFPEHLQSSAFMAGMDLPALADAFFTLTGRVLPIPPPVNPPSPPRSAVNITAISPTRLLDSRSGNGLTGKFVSHVPRSVVIAGRGGIPAEATIVGGNLTITTTAKGGYVSVGPDLIVNPSTSTQNFVAGQTIANYFTCALHADGTLALVYVGDPGATVDLIVDIAAYFTP